MQRTALSTKSVNIQPTRSPTKRSPTKRLESPTKSTVFNVSPTKKSRKQTSNMGLSFTIFQDPVTSSSSRSASDSPESKLIPGLSNTFISEDKENEGRLKHKITTTAINNNANTYRTPLSDLNIIAKPGYVHLGKATPLSSKNQLNEPWYSSNPDMKCIPSFITPSKRRKVKYISTMNESNNNYKGVNLLEKLEQFGKDDLEVSRRDNNRKDHDFYIYHD